MSDAVVIFLVVTVFAVLVWSAFRPLVNYPEELPSAAVKAPAFRLWTTLGDVAYEVERASLKHRPMNSPHEGHSVIREELDELWEHVRADTGRTTKARAEAIQIAATAVRYAMDLTDGR